MMNIQQPPGLMNRKTFPQLVSQASARFGGNVEVNKNHPLLQRATVPTLWEKINILCDLVGKALNFLFANTLGQFSQAFTALRSWAERLGEKAGFKKPERPNRMLLGDAYTTVSERYISKDAKDYSSYHITFRRDLTPWMKEMGISPKDSRFVFFGLQQVLRELLHDPITKEEIDAADEFFKTARNQKEFKWDRRVWDRVLNEHNGFIPIKVEALPDGAANFPGEPCIQITAKGGFGELAAWFESKLVQVWATSERATLARYWLDYNKDLVRQCTNENLTDEQVTKKAQLLLADFSDRSSMNMQESEQLGLANLTSFPVTATVSAAYRAYLESGKNSASSLSMYSLAHRVVQSFDKEGDAYENLALFAKGEMGSYVADCYDFRRAVTNYLVPLAQKSATSDDPVARKTIICARPDSGDPYEQIKFVLDEAVKAGLYKEVTAKDGRKLKAMTNLRVIQADGMKFSTVKEINDKLIAAGYSPPDCVYYGVGGYLHDSLKRSNMSAAQKLAEVGHDQRPAMKSPKLEDGTIEIGKESIPGRVKLVRDAEGAPSVRGVDEPGENELITWYDGIDDYGLTYVEDFRNVQNRVLNDFHAFPKPKQLLSDHVREVQAELREKYHGKAPAAQEADTGTF